MIIDQEKCIGCGQCLPYCPVNAINMQNKKAKIDFDECVECSSCMRSNICPTDSFYQQELKWPRTIRSIMSDVFTIATETGVSGRGTEEIKTNELTGRFKHGQAGIAIEVGRPVLGTRFHDVEKIAMSICSLGNIEFEKANPITTLMIDSTIGNFRKDILDEKVYSAILEFAIPISRLPEVLNRIKEVSQEIDTVFSLCLCCRVSEDNSIPTEQIAKDAGFNPSINGKTNVGLGKASGRTQS